MICVMWSTESAYLVAQEVRGMGASRVLWEHLVYVMDVASAVLVLLVTRKDRRSASLARAAHSHCGPVVQTALCEVH